MNIKTRVFRGIALFFAFVLIVSITVGIFLESYRQPLDENIGTTSSQVVVDSEDGEWTYGTQYTSTKDAVESMKEFAIREAAESFVLLKNENNSLPLSGEKPKVTLFGIRSYVPYYGSTTGGSIPDRNAIEHADQLGAGLQNAFEQAFDVNPQMLQAYEDYTADMTWGSQGYGATAPIYVETYSSTDPTEPTLEELDVTRQELNYGEYSDAAIVIIGRVSGEGTSFYPGEVGRTTTDEDGNVTNVVNTDTDNILGLSDEEKAIIEEAKACSDNVIVLVNTSSQMEIEGLKQDADVDAVMWIGYPGVYGFEAVASVLKGEVSPSGHLGDTYAVNSALSPAMQNYGGDEAGTQIAWANASSYGQGDNVNSYLVNAEGIYTGYRYYETRYADAITGAGQSDASAASAGTYVDYNLENMTFKPATTDGAWNYSHEVSYSFGYGLSYTTFTQQLTNVTVSEDYKTATATVVVTNTGDVAGMDVVQLYAQAPYTQYDIANGVEKSAIQLIDYEKTDTLEPGASETVTLNIDMSNLASYDYTNAETFILEGGTYYFAVGNSSHDALNNILAQQGYTADDGLVNEDGTAYEASEMTTVAEWNSADNGLAEGTQDSQTFSVSDATGAEITNQVTEGDSAMDANYWLDNGINGNGTEQVTYLSRNDWDGTFPVTYGGWSITAGSRFDEVMRNDFISFDDMELKDEDADLTVGDTSIDIEFNDMKGVAFDDERWNQLVSKIPVEEMLDFMANAFHNIQGIPSIGFNGYGADDGPGGSDSHDMSEASNRGELFEDAAGYEDVVGTRISPAQINLAYTWNKNLAYENGEIILGESTLLYNLPIMIGPGMNIHRTPYNGRNVEYFSEDPILSGYTGSNIVQGAQSKGCLVNIKHAAFNSQEANRSGVNEFLNEQAARELELRNLQQAFTAKGRSSKSDVEGQTYKFAADGALGVMTAYNRVGATASSANEGVMVNILRGEWGFIGYSVTDFTGVTMKAAPKESILFGTTAYCGMGSPSIDYWDAEILSDEPAMIEALKQDMHYALYALAQSYAMDLNINTRTISLVTWWRAAYISLITVSAVIVTVSALLYVGFSIRDTRKLKEKEVQ